jgi:hypothetical protein
VKITIELHISSASGFISPNPHEVAEAVLRKLNHPGLSPELRNVVIDTDAGYDTTMRITSARLVNVQD